VFRAVSHRNAIQRAPDEVTREPHRAQRTKRQSTRDDFRPLFSLPIVLRLEILGARASPHVVQVVAGRARGRHKGCRSSSTLRVEESGAGRGRGRRGAGSEEYIRGRAGMPEWRDDGPSRPLRGHLIVKVGRPEAIKARLLLRPPPGVIITPLLLDRPASLGVSLGTPRSPRQKLATVVESPCAGSFAPSLFRAEDLCNSCCIE
jgi:hypothetical protein